MEVWNVGRVNIILILMPMPHNLQVKTILTQILSIINDAEDAIVWYQVRHAYFKARPVCFTNTSTLGNFSFSSINPLIIFV